MNIHDIELPPIPDLPAYSSEVFDREVKVVSETMAEQLMHDYARAAIEPYQRRIAELESQLEAIGAGGVSARRITSTPSNENDKITKRSQAYLDSNLDADEHEAFINWAREAHDYPDYARLILDSEWCQGAVAGWQGAIEADRQLRGEPVSVIRFERNKPGNENEMPKVISCNQLPDGDYQVFLAPHQAEPVNVPDNGCECNQGQSCQVCDPVLEPAQEPSDDDIRRVARDMYLAGDLTWIGFDRDENGEYTQPTITGGHITLFRALLARYGQPVEHEGWQLVPKELINFLDAKEHHLPIEDVTYCQSCSQPPLNLEKNNDRP